VLALHVMCYQRLKYDTTFKQNMIHFFSFTGSPGGFPVRSGIPLNQLL
jgi:hypothetical protein